VLEDDPRFWSYVLVSATLIALWAVQSGRFSLLQTVWTAPDSSYAVGDTYAANSTGSGSSGGGTLASIAGDVGTISGIVGLG
jgi:hypothetical protein